jgi:rhodanese-related sulfurtransferase
MKAKTVAVIAILIVLLSSTFLLPMVKANPHTDINVATAYAMIYSTDFPNLVVMDVRVVADFNTEHILGAINVPVIPLGTTPQTYDTTALYSWISSPEGQSHKNDEIIVHCRTGGRSNLASGILEANGFSKVYDLSVGISSTNQLLAAWKNAGYPTIHVIATVDIKPETLNLKSEGKWVTCYIELPSPNLVDNIVAPIKMCGISAASKPMEIGDYDGDAIPDLMVKFDRLAVQDLLGIGENRLWVTFGLSNVKLCGGWDTIRVID